MRVFVEGHLVHGVLVAVLAHLLVVLLGVVLVDVRGLEVLVGLARELLLEAVVLLVVLLLDIVAVGLHHQLAVHRLLSAVLGEGVAPRLVRAVVLKNPGDLAFVLLLYRLHLAASHDLVDVFGHYHWPLGSDYCLVDLLVEPRVHKEALSCICALEGVAVLVVLVLQHVLRIGLHSLVQAHRLALSVGLVLAGHLIARGKLLLNLLRLCGLALALSRGHDPLLVDPHLQVFVGIGNGNGLVLAVLRDDRVQIGNGVLVRVELGAGLGALAPLGLHLQSGVDLGPGMLWLHESRGEATVEHFAAFGIFGGVTSSLRCEFGAAVLLGLRLLHIIVGVRLVRVHLRVLQILPAVGLLFRGAVVKVDFRVGGVNVWVHVVALVLPQVVLARPHFLLLLMHSEFLAAVYASGGEVGRLLVGSVGGTHPRILPAGSPCGVLRGLVELGGIGLRVHQLVVRHDIVAVLVLPVIRLPRRLQHTLRARNLR